MKVCTTAFYTPGNLANAIKEFMGSTFGARPNAFAKGVRVKAMHLGYKKTIKSVSNLTARQHKFHVAELNREVTVEEYFRLSKYRFSNSLTAFFDCLRSEYKITLKQPDLPLVDVGGMKQNLLPPELCEILPDQPFRGKLTDEHTANMITVAAKPPNINAENIVNHGLRQLGFSQAAPQLNAFGVSIGTQMTVVPGRILQAPSIKYSGQGSPNVDERASWNLRDVKFAKGARLDGWGVLLIKDGNDRDEFASTTDPALLATVRGFAQMCRKSGMSVDQKDPLFAKVELPRKTGTDPTRAAAVSLIRASLMSMPKKPTIVLVILSTGDKHIYNGIKHLCDVHLDLGKFCYAPLFIALLIQFPSFRLRSV